MIKFTLKLIPGGGGRDYYFVLNLEGRTLLSTSYIGECFASVVVGINDT